MIYDDDDDMIYDDTYDDMIFGGSRLDYEQIEKKRDR